MIDILLGSPHMDIRLSVVDQLYQLCQTINTGKRGDEERKREEWEGEGEEVGERGGSGRGGWGEERKEGEGREEVGRRLRGGEGGSGKETEGRGGRKWEGD